jgi:AraC family transcriptional regulator
MSIETNTGTDFYLVDHFPEANYWEKHNDLFHNKNVIINASANKIEYPRHWGTLSVKTVLSGHETYVANEMEYKLNENAYLILNYDQYYGSYIKETDTVESLSIHFTRLFERSTLYYLQHTHDELINEPFNVDSSDMEFTVTQHAYSCKMKSLILRIKHLVASLTENSHQIEEIYCQLYIEIFKAQQGLNKLKQDLKAVKSSTRDEVFKRVTLAKDYMDSNYNNPELNLSDLAKLSCMNNFHLLRCFSQVYKLTPYQYLKHLRFQRAYELLKTRKYSVSHVVELCGYQDTSSFDKTFKKKYSVSPGRCAEDF